MIHQSFTLLNNIGWPAQECRQFAEALALKVMLPGDPQLPDGLKLHLADIYVDELLKVPLDKVSQTSSYCGTQAAVVENELISLRFATCLCRNFLFHAVIFE